MWIGMKDTGGEKALWLFSSQECCGIFTLMVDPRGKPCTRPTCGLVFLKEAKSTAQTWSAGALCMKDDGGIHSWA